MTFDLYWLVGFSAIVGLLYFWFKVSRRLLSFCAVVYGSIMIYLALRSDRQPAHLVGLFVAFLFVGLLVLVLAALLSRNRNSIHRVSARDRRRYNAQIARADARDLARAAKAERNAPEVSTQRPARQLVTRQQSTSVPASLPARPRVRRSTPTDAPARTRVRRSTPTDAPARSQRQGGYVVNARKDR